MTGANRDVRRRSVLSGVGAGLLPLGLGTAAGDPVSDGVDEAVSATPSVFGEVGRRINELRYPLTGVPAIREPGETLRVELDVGDGILGSGTDAEVGSVEASLTPSFGSATPERELPLESTETAESTVWPDAEHLIARFEIPDLDRTFTESMYDLEVRFDDEVDGQPRAVSVVESFPDEPEVAIVGDPHAGDPRPIQDGAERSLEEGDPGPFVFRFEETWGTGTEDDRWGAWQRANAELNGADPDLVLVIGDLAFGSSLYYQEYEDAYRLLNEIDAPTFVTVGNHDGYVTPGAGIDGKELWRRYFAPWHYSVDVRPDLHFVSVDSYDWPALDRIAPSAVPSTWGGQVRDEQLSWLEADLRSWREDNDGTILTLSHHNPSWVQTEGGGISDLTDGTPAAEQIGRGAEQSGGGWVGANRLAVRDLLEEYGVTMHVSGHAHRDRVARYHGDSSIVATTGTGLEHRGPDGGTVETSDDRRREVLSDGDGTLFVEATTSASGTSQYWGWRTVPVGLDGGRLDPTTFGYPATDEFLEERALDPGAWTASNADLGLYSTPSYLLDATVLEADRERVAVRVENDLARAFAGAVTLPLAACRGVRVTNGERRWQREEGDWQDVRVDFEVPAGESLDVTAECVSREPH